MTETYVVIKVDSPCGYLDDESTTCESIEHYCDRNIAASVHCGALFGVEGYTLDTEEGTDVVVYTDDVLDDEQESLTYGRFLSTYRSLRHYGG